ncbi:MAG TPA: tripartite tricarboxylate transporter substrate binding protein [Paracoccaceae bacterium]|nr:tripartite tricarboxylate transporter substrate binding protein [Paracoccaceae bacterium]
MTRRAWIALAGAAALQLAAVAPAGAWEPNKPIDFVIMAGPGGGADQMARFIQSIVEKHNLSPRPLVPTNKAGGSGAEALVYMNTVGDPDYSIMVTLNSFFTTPLRQPDLKVDIMNFAPVGRMAQDTFLLWVHKDEGVKSFEEFLAKATSMGDQWVMGGTGRAQEDEIITNFLNNEFGLSMKYIPYKGGGEVAKELAGRQVHSTVNNPAEALGFYQSGDLIPLVAFTDDRLEGFPEVPTMAEVGKPFSYTMQRAIVGAPGMSDEALAFYTDLFQKVAATEEWQEYKAKTAQMADFLAGDDLKAYWSEMRDTHEKILRGSGDIR